jgi:hypothetical protein
MHACTKHRWGGTWNMLEPMQLGSSEGMCSCQILMVGDEDINTSATIISSIEIVGPII